MLCPYCHSENKYDALTCDFCMRELPMDSKRVKEIKTKKKIERKNIFSTSIAKMIGTILGVLAIILIIVFAWLKTRG